MKKVVRIFSLVLVLTLLMSAMPMAMAENVKGTTKFEVTYLAAGISYESDDFGLAKLTYSGEGKFTEGKGYAIFVIKGTKEAYESGELTIDKEHEDLILYVNQVQATNSDSITFEKVYLMNLADCIVVITGEGLNGEVVATIDMNYLLGDVNDDGKINVMDTVLTAQKVAKMEIAGTFIEDAADVNGDNKINVMDTVLIAQYVAKIISVFPADN